MAARKARMDATKITGKLAFRQDLHAAREKHSWRRAVWAGTPSEGRSDKHRSATAEERMEKHGGAKEGGEEWGGGGCYGAVFDGVACRRKDLYVYGPPLTSHRRTLVPISQLSSGRCGRVPLPQEEDYTVDIIPPRRHFPSPSLAV
ncbi:hypothetical protein HPB50_023088 [Hyalomma asiaticum]|uniref:Uncharacterized protein n=1 Tax=Hyalomma asiaticum TaxID=266040 RepID=A0ACB7TPP7_HYAAI|nr:hypothetical protein HPB50_023088 [Hyalomma asiaticum]